MPSPCGANDVVELGVARLPTQLLDCLFGTGDEDSRIAGAAWVEFGWNGVACDAAGRFNDFANAESMPVAEVVDEASVRGDIGVERFEGEEVGVGEVGDVDVIADAGAVGGGVVVAVDADRLAATQGDIQDERDEVGFGLVIFAAADAIGTFGGAGDVEIAKGDGAEAVDGVKPLENGFDHQLRFTVGVCRFEARALGDGDGLGLAIDGRGGGKDEAAGTLGDDGLEHGEGGGGVVTEVGAGVDHGFAGFNKSSEMKDRIKGLAFSFCGLENFFNQSTIGEVSFDEFDTGRNHLAASMAEVVKHNRLMTLREEKSGDCASDVSGTAGNQSSHKNTVLPERNWVTVSLLQQATRRGLRCLNKDRR